MLTPLLFEREAAAQLPAAPPARIIVKWSSKTPGQALAVTPDDGSGPGPLRITYSDGSTQTVPNECCRFRDGNNVQPQQNFTNIKLAEDKQTIGWLADYLACAASYPCSLELVLFRSGHVVQRIAASEGALWDWNFLDHGKKLVTESAFLHGSAYADGRMKPDYALYDTNTGRLLAHYDSTGKKPDWAKTLLPIDN